MGSQFLGLRVMISLSSILLLGLNIFHIVDIFDDFYDGLIMKLFRSISNVLGILSIVISQMYSLGILDITKLL